MQIQKQLRQHQGKAFRRHPMFERNLGVRIFMFIMFGILALELLAFGFFLDGVCLELGSYQRAIDCFNAGWIYIFLADFVVKFIVKRSQSMQIAPYLMLPIKRNTLYDFVLKKEFTNVWNFYLFFLVLPFSFKVIPPFFGVGAAFLYLVYFYLICVTNSHLVRIVDNLFRRNALFVLVPIAIAAIVICPPVLWDFSYGDYTKKIGEAMLTYNPLPWIGLLLILFIFWTINRRQMRSEVYREMQGEKQAKAGSFSGISYLDKLGEVGDFINLEIKMLTRSKRLKQQLFILAYFIVFLFWQIYTKHGMMASGDQFLLMFFFLFIIGGMGLILGQYLMMTESAHLDGLMARNHSIRDMFRAKYLLYVAYSLFVTIVLLIPVFHGRISLLFLIACFLFTIGPMYCFIFQNAVYNKAPFDIFESGMFNWKGTSSSSMVITMTVMFVPLLLLLLVGKLTSDTTMYWSMIVIGLAFVLTSNRWIGWTYKRFMARRYKNMEGFRSNE